MYEAKLIYVQTLLINEAALRLSHDAPAQNINSTFVLKNGALSFWQTLWPNTIYRY